MSYAAADARQQILDQLALSTEQLGTALTALGDAYDWIDEHTADRLEEQLFRPVQHAYGRARRTHAEFADRHRLPQRGFEQPSSIGHPGDARGAIERAAASVSAADETLSTLQDSMLPVEVGDQELRAGLTQVRELVADVPHRSRQLLRTLGR